MVDHAERPHQVERPWKYYAALAASASPLPFAIMPFFTDDWSTTGAAFAFLAGAYIATSIYVVQENEVGGIWIFQQRAMEVGPGIYLVPRVIGELNKLPTSSQQDQIPGEPEQISKRHDEEGLQPGQVYPIRVTTAADPGTDFNDDPLSKRLTLEVTISIVWRVRHTHFFEMWERIPGANWEEMRARVVKQLRDTAETQLVERISSRTTARVLTEFAVLNEEIKEELQKAIGPWGIEIESCELQAPDVPLEVNQALARLSAAHADGVATVTTAQAARQAEVLRATGEAEGRERLAEAERTEIHKRGIGMKQAAAELDISGADYYRGDVARDTVGEGDLVLGLDLEAAVQAIGIGKAALRGDKKKESSDA